MLGLGQGAVIPIVPLVAVELGASPPMAGAIVALRGIGTMVFDLPAGVLVSRFGDRRSMVLATLALIVSLVGCAHSATPQLFAVFTFSMGCSWSVWLLARQSYVADVLPTSLRGRGLSTVGGANRLGMFVGPFLAALTIQLGGLGGAFYVHIVAAAIGCAALALVSDPHQVEMVHRHAGARLVAVVREHRTTFMTVGIGTMSIGVVRASRQVVLPLWADHIGLGAAAVAVIFGLSAAIDMMLFYPGGYMSDRWGRRFVAIPCLVIMALGHVGLPLTGSFMTLCVAGLVMGFGNGLGSGIVMTLGADFSPTVGRASFLGAFRLVGDAGTAIGPVIVSLTTAAASLGVAVVVVGGIGLVTSIVLFACMPESLGTTASERPVVAEGGGS